MSMPLDLVLVRHGQSEGNAANRLSRRGDDSAFTPEFRNRHSSQWRLTDVGRQQAQTAGACVRERVKVFDRFYTSEYVRAMETAALLNLPGAEWFTEFYLREREWGELDVMPNPERLAKYGDVLQRRTNDTYYWIPPGGRAIVEVCLRVDRVLDTLHRECSRQRVIIVCHGEVMWAFRIRLERISQRRYSELDRSLDPYDRIHNGQVLHYTRLNPATGEEAPYLSWLWSECPSDRRLSRNAWETIARPRYSNEDLLRVAEAVPRLVNDTEGWIQE